VIAWRVEVFVLKTLPIDTPIAAIQAYCQRHRVQRLSLFGSVLRDDFTQESDVDVLLGFEPGAGWG
jgi:predicted nucleotidyltransferase